MAAARSKKLPDSVASMRLAIGTIRNIEDVRKAAAQISEWAVDAAEERYKELPMSLGMDDVLKLVYEAAKEKWPGFENYVTEIQGKEREFIRKAGAMA